MTEGQSEDIGPLNNTADASVKRFEARQAHRKSTEGKVIAAVREEESTDRKNQKNAEPVPDVVEKQTSHGAIFDKITWVEKWKKDKKIRRKLKDK